MAAARSPNALIEHLTGGLEPPVLDVCRHIISALLAIPLDQQRRLSFVRLAELGHSDWKDHIFQSAIAALTTMPQHPLYLYYVMYDDVEDREISISRAEVAEALAENSFIHPNTGEEVPAFTEKLVPVFATTNEFQALAKVS